MLSLKWSNFSCFFLLCCIFVVSGNRVKDRIYDTIEGTAACFRRMNGTHQFGCASHRKGNVGVLQLVKTSDDLQWLLDKGPVPPYMVILHMDMFTKAVMVALKDSGKVGGAVLLKDPETPSVPHSTLSHFTHEDTCPNRYSGLSNMESQQCSDRSPWNAEGTALLLVDWGFPIFYVHNQTSVDKITKCFAKYNSDREEMESRSLCAMEMKAFMFAAKDSETCIRRNRIVRNLNPVTYCDPLGDRNIWATIFPRNRDQPEKERSMLVLAARLDSTSMFDGEVAGAGSAVAGLVTTLAAAKLLAALRPHMEPLRDGRNVMVALLNGEAYDYIGSGRMVYDMQAGNFPSKDLGLQALNLTSLRLFVEMNQVTRLNTTAPNSWPTLYFHPTPGQANKVNSEVTEFMSLMAAQSTVSKINFETSNATHLPPASLQSFVRADPGLPGVVITDHNDRYVNKFYHSLLDDASLLGFKYLNGSAAPDPSVQTHLASLASALVRSVYHMTTGQPYSGDLQVTPAEIDELLFCYLGSMNCSLFRSGSHPLEFPPDLAPSLYVGVYQQPPMVDQVNMVTRYTAGTLALFTGTVLANLTRPQCKINSTDMTYMYSWLRGTPDASENSSVCIRSTVNLSLALSPAFIKDDYNWSSGEFSTWTESIWQEFGVRIFLKPSRGHEAAVMSIGCVVLVLSFVVIYFIASKSDVLFNSNVLNGGC